jgi:hypothetical protein
MIHKPDPNRQWRVRVLHHEWWRSKPRWVWKRYMGIGLPNPLPPIFHIITYLSVRGLVRAGLARAVRLIMPGGEVAAEEYATFASTEAVGPYRRVKRRIGWPKRWRVKGGKRLGAR